MTAGELDAFVWGAIAGAAGGVLPMVWLAAWALAGECRHRRAAAAARRELRAAGEVLR